MKQYKNIRHLIIDEMQDYSYLQYVILESMFSCSMTILGDRAQTVDDEPRDVLTFLSKIFGKSIREVEMNRSYRNTLEIAEYAAKWSDASNIKFLERHGKAVEEVAGVTRQEAMDDILQKVHVTTDGFETAAVLTMTEGQAREVAQYLQKKREDVFFVDRDSSAFKKGITVTTYYLAKGLEFDQVFIFGAEKENALFRQFQYISATRALHELYVYEVKK